MFPKKTLLVIETEESYRDSIREAFQDCFTLLMAKDSNEAVKLFEQSEEPISLVITDLVMPYRSGDVMIEWFRVINPKLPILLFTSSVGSEEVTGLLQLPLVFTIDKMADLRSFASTVEKLCLFSEGQNYQNGHSIEEYTNYDHKENKKMPRGTILVVDDSPIENRLVSNLLTNEGYRVLTASDGEEALTKASQEKPDLIVLDVVMPKKNGFETCRSLKTLPNTKDIKVVMLTSKNQKSDQFWGKAQGADEYLTKPFKEQELLAAISRQL